MRQRGLFGEERELQIITHSAAECFQECRVKWDYRYNREIVPTEPQPALDFGTAIHAGLEFWFKYGTAAGAVEAGVSRGAELGMATADLCKVQVLLERYTEIYKEEPFEVVEVEKTFRTVLVNPRTMCQSRTYAYMGKVDALDADGIEWRALCEIYRETCAPEITYDNARAIDAAARHMRELGIADGAQLRRIMWQRLTDRSLRLKDIALTIGSGSDFSTAI